MFIQRQSRLKGRREVKNTLIFALQSKSCYIYKGLLYKNLYMRQRFFDLMLVRQRLDRRDTNQSDFQY